jgi:hypothetical protein
MSHSETSKEERRRSRFANLIAFWLLRDQDFKLSMIDLVVINSCDTLLVL